MKRFMGLLLVCMLLLAFTGSTFAAGEEIPAGESRERGWRYEALKEFKEQIHEINSLRIQFNTLQVDVIEKHDEIIDLYIAAREAGEREKLQQAREVRGEIKAVNEEIREYRNEIREEREAFRENVKNLDFEAAGRHLDRIIELKKLINGKMAEKVELLEEIIEILS